MTYKKHAFLTVSLVIFVITLCAIIPICIQITPKRSLAQFQQELIGLFKVFQKVAEEYNITYWASGGTFLGARREGKIIEWDDDIDLEIWDEDRQILVEHEEEIIKKYNICFTRDILYNSFGGALKIQYANYDQHPEPFIDCATMIKRDKKIVIGSDFIRNLYPHCYHDFSDMVLENIPFEDTFIPAPISNSYLENCYGQDWKIPKKRYSHYFYIDGKMPLMLGITLGTGGFFVLVAVAFLIVALTMKIVEEK
jgi:hypothetical protein